MVPETGTIHKVYLTGSGGADSDTEVKIQGNEGNVIIKCRLMPERTEYSGMTGKASTVQLRSLTRRGLYHLRLGVTGLATTEHILTCRIS